MSTVTEAVEGDDFTLSADFALATMDEDDDAGFSTGGAEVFASDDV